MQPDIVANEIKTPEADLSKVTEETSGVVRTDITRVY